MQHLNPYVEETQTAIRLPCDCHMTFKSQQKNILHITGLISNVDKHKDK